MQIIKKIQFSKKINLKITIRLDKYRKINKTYLRLNKMIIQKI